MNALIPFTFENSTLRVVEIDGEPWFVGKDVAEALGYADPTTAIRSHCKGVQKRHPLPTPGGTQELRILAEPDVLRLIVNSTLPSAERIERWLFEEVLPSIRKTGSYSVKPKPALRIVATDFRAALSIAKTAGLKGNQAILAADKAVQRVCGVTPLALIDATHLTAEVKARHYTPTELGQRYSESGQAFNRRLEKAGLQVKNTANQWIATPKGEPHALLCDVGKAHSSGVPVQQLRWLETVMNLLAACTPAPALIQENRHD